MPALTLNGAEVKATELRRLPDERGGGGLRRTVNGELRGRSDWVKRAWSGVLFAANEVERAALEALADPDSNVTAAGDAIGAAATVRVAITGETSYVRERNGTSWHFLVPVSLREV